MEVPFTLMVLSAFFKYIQYHILSISNMHLYEKGLLVIYLQVLAVLTEDVPCALREYNAGYVCVCNNTYCDTIENSPVLGEEYYYHYSTSESTPGFTKNTGSFSKGTQIHQSYNEISKDVHITINTTVVYQTFKGIGASFTDSAGILFNSLSAETKLKFIESYFSSNGLEYTLARVPIGGADFSLQPYTNDDVAGDVDLKYFNLTNEDYTNKIPIIKEAITASSRGMHLVATPWTAPSWMKTNNASDPGYLYKKYQETYAKYILKFLEAYHNVGIDFWGLTQGNEVMIPLFFGAHFSMPNLIMMPNQARYWTKHCLGPILTQSYFKDIKILTLDDERPFMSWWSSRMFRDEEIAKYVDGIALHWYFDGAATVSRLEDFHKSFPGKFILYTESSINTFQSGGGPVSLGDWSRAVRYINNIFQNFGHWVVGYMDWNIALNEEGGPTGPSNISLDASIIINSTSDEFYKQPTFYVLGHFSKFISPGSKRVQVTIKQDVSNVEELSSTLEMRERLAHKFNFREGPTPDPTLGPFPTRKPDPPSITVLALATNNPDGSRTLIAYNPRSDVANLIVEDSEAGRFQQVVASHSLNSFVYWPKKTMV